MWACTPSSLRRDNSKEQSKAVSDLPLPDAVPLDTLIEKVRENVPDAIAESVAETVAQSVPDSVLKSVPESVLKSVAETVADSVLKSVPESVADSVLKSVADSVLKSVADSVLNSVPESVLKSVAETVADSVLKSVPESVPESVAETVAAGADALKEARQKAEEEARQLDRAALDSLIGKTGGEAAAKTKRDTTTMDSLELAIYKYNKVVDDSLALDSVNRARKNGIDAPVRYSANDSLTYEAGSGTAHLYGDSHVEYQNMDLKSEKIYMVLDSSLVHATGVMDSTARRLTGTPVFKMGSDEYQSDTMAFNFKTKKGLITQVYTEQEDGFLTSELSKRGAGGELFLQHGRYTTCDDPHPDFYIAMSRAKVRPGKDVVFGPAYLVVCDVPLPLAVPYGFFPFTKSYSSGFIMPTYGDESERGFYLRDGGYYFAISDKMDLKLIGEIYTKGSWGLTATSNYNRRYKYRGSFLLSYQNSVRGEKNLPDFERTTSFKLTWTHNQDSKANPFSTLQARVNFASQSFERNNLTSMYNPQTLTQSTRTSSVAFTTRFSSLGMTVSSSMDLSQNMRDSSISMTLPRLNIDIARFYPFKRKKMAGKERWYEKISANYRGEFSNSINTKEDKLLHSDFRRDWKNGITHSIPISANFMFLDNFNINPSFNFSDKMSFIKARKHWDKETQKEVTDTVTGLYNVYNWSLNLGVSTTLYGMYVPSRKLFGDKIQAIRHVLTPTISFQYAPNFSVDRYGFYEYYDKVDAEGNVSRVQYWPYSVGNIGQVSNSRTGRISIDLKNNVEMKVRSADDSVKKVSLIDEFSLRTGYNLATNVRPMDDVSTTLRIKFTKSYTLNLSLTFASYVYEADSVGAVPRVSEHTTYWEKGKIGPFSSISKSISYNLDNSKVVNFLKWLRGEKVDKKGKEKTKTKEEEEQEEDDLELESNVDVEMEKAKRGAKKENAGKAETDEDGYMTFNLPWSLRFDYGVTMHESRDVKKFNYNTMRYPYEFSHHLNFSGNVRLSDGWNIQLSSGYDFENKKISMTTASLSRDLHCFNMSCSVVLAPYASYNFSFRCNASTLTDALKYDKRSSYSNSVQWY
jgi:hypothetical protein